ncbi:hypothetical protein RclHR1_00230022 [Rhizophagus clarus]|uniref:Transmembrane protein n=1 Tax=Rhizophagus clarus TaxID=94130 RepID=A0A2Z6R8L8_9GLOM|nr:hypothetical protein RclHR1_00230022 [Rhizophagus clarus]GES72926.1 hypothetical protein GLOIN_2v1727228 [Rhizophagus clarus]
MKSYCFFIFLNALILFAYAQNQTIPSTCEQYFALNGTQSCTSCQQAIYNTQQQPTAKCNVISILLSNSFISTTSGIDSLRDGINKTCTETAANPCNESDAINAYTEVDKACDAELNIYFAVKGTVKETTPPYSNDANIGSNAAITIFFNYLGIPFRESLCTKVEGEFCLIKQASQNQSPNITSPFDFTECDDCGKQNFDILKRFQSSHPLDTPNLQKVMADSTTNVLQAFEQKCPNLASDAQKLTSQFYNYPVTILISLIGFIYATFI